MEKNTEDLAKQITLKSSRQAYFTVKFFADKKTRTDCYKAYAYFRWLDDKIDKHINTSSKRLAFIKKQKAIINSSYKKTKIHTNSPQERMLASLIENDPRTNPKLESFIRNFFSIIEFDAKRKDKKINQKQLDWYTKTLGKAVTDCIEYFVDNKGFYPDSPSHYKAATAACITHILRDMNEDFDNGYFNFPNKDTDIIKSEVKKARKYFAEGKAYINRLPGLRSRFVALCYCNRFEWILDTIERDKFSVRENYHPKKHFLNLAYFLGSLLTLIARYRIR